MVGRRGCGRQHAGTCGRRFVRPVLVACRRRRRDLREVHLTQHLDRTWPPRDSQITGMLPSPTRQRSHWPWRASTCVHVLGTATSSPGGRTPMPVAIADRGATTRGLDPVQQAATVLGRRRSMTTNATPEHFAQLDHSRRRRVVSDARRSMRKHQRRRPTLPQ
jgi:hypothetical protein